MPPLIFRLSDHSSVNERLFKRMKNKEKAIGKFAPTVSRGAV
jgi:hypothetical protein